MIEVKGKYADAVIYADTIEDGVIEQVKSMIDCKAFSGQKVVCMPDVHVGASAPCGVVATIGDYVCPEHIGVDIGCCVSMMLLDKPIPESKYSLFEYYVKQNIPFGFDVHETYSEYDKELLLSYLTVEFKKYKSYWPQKLIGLPDVVDEKWIKAQLQRIGMDEDLFYRSIGTVGGGNHFIEYDEGDGMYGVTFHFGSRNFGKRVCEYWMDKAKTALTKQEIHNLTFEFKKQYEGDMRAFRTNLNLFLDMHKVGHIDGYLCGENMDAYLCDMCFAQLYALFNHDRAQKCVATILKNIFCISVTDVIKSVHNFIDLHDHMLRKSAIRSYKGELMLVPFNMRDGVAICEGLSNGDWLNSCAHGAGRKMSRKAAFENVSLEEFKESMKNVYSTTVCEGTIDESPMAYKDTREIKDLIQETCKIKYMLIPKINIKAVSKKVFK